MDRRPLSSNWGKQESSIFHFIIIQCRKYNKIYYHARYNSNFQDLNTLSSALLPCLCQELVSPATEGNSGEESSKAKDTMNCQEKLMKISHFNQTNQRLLSMLSSPRAESARAFTGRRNSHSGRGEDFLSHQPNFFTETAVTPERKVEKWFPRWEINRHAEG